MTFSAYMIQAESNYAFMLDGLKAAGIPAVFTQTGGGCLAIEVVLSEDNDEHRVLITDAQGPLPFEPDTVTGYMLGYYGPENDMPIGGDSEYHPEEFGERDLVTVPLTGAGESDLAAIVAAYHDLLGRDRS